MGYNFREVPCNVCGSRESVSLGRRDPKSFALPEHLLANIVRCRECGLLYPNPMPFADEKQIQENYGAPEEYFPAALSRQRFDFYRRIIRRIEKMLGHKGRLLDIGCGRGELLSVAAGEGWQAQGVEYSSRFAEYAKKKFGVEVAIGDLDNLQPTPDSFDAVCLVSVLQHVYDPKKLLTSVRKVLKDDGLLFIETMNNAGMVYRLGDLYNVLRGRNITTNLSPTFPSYQIYGFSPESLRRLFRETGLCPVKIKIKGGISRTEKISVKSAGDLALRLVRAAIMFLSGVFNQGQVIMAYVRKAGGNR